ncbi:MAG TPA: HAD-IB family phosphatase [Xanthomonadales bacterium]|nr:HAD-IB family phosphatase [Xanthomonadales bacterium]
MSNVPMRRVALFDFDGCLIRGDSFARLLRTLIERSPARRALALAALPVLLPMLATQRWKGHAARSFVRIATSGRDAAVLEAAIAAELERAKSRWIEPAWAALDAHRAAGDRVIVVTGAGDVLARPLLASRDRGGIELVASPVELRRGGWVARRHCFGAEKVRMLAEIGVEPPWDVAYSDSSVDLPMLAGARRAVLVSPKPRCEAAVQRVLPGIEVVRW